MKHTSVLLEESVEALNIKPDGIYIDATMGGGGHSAAICEKLGRNGTFIGIDQDDYAYNTARERLKDYPCRKIFIKDNFKNLKEHLIDNDIPKVDGILFDLGVSSFQFDDASRGFSYHNDGPLDMRMDRSLTTTAADIIEKYSREELTTLFRDYGEERFASRIAERIVSERKEKPITTTLQLAEIIRSAYPAKFRYKGKHPARKVFQALRIKVNEELSILPESLAEAVESLNSGGIIAVITFHSLEDRIVKHFIREKENPQTNGLGIPVKSQPEPVLKRLNKKPVVPSNEEIQENNRARSAKLRVAQKI